MFKQLIKYLLKVIPNLFNILIFDKKRTKNVNYELVDKNSWISFFYSDEYFKDKKNKYKLFYETPFGGCFIIK